MSGRIEWSRLPDDGVRAASLSRAHKPGLRAPEGSTTSPCRLAAAGGRAGLGGGAPACLRQRWAEPTAALSYRTQSARVRCVRHASQFDLQLTKKVDVKFRGRGVSASQPIMIGTHGSAIVQPIRGETGHAHSNIASMKNLDAVPIGCGRIRHNESRQKIDLGSINVMQLNLKQLD